MKKYGQEKAPCYNLGDIRLHNISFYVGSTDALVSIDDVKTIVRQMKVPHKLNLIDRRGTYFNHMAFFLHKRTDKLAVLPSFLDFERSQLNHDSFADNDLTNFKMPNFEGGRKTFDPFLGGSNEIDQ